MPNNKYDTIFERFEKGVKETSRKYGGNHGFTISKNYLKHIILILKTKFKKGSEFYFPLGYDKVDKYNFY